VRRIKKVRWKKCAEKVRRIQKVRLEKVRRNSAESGSCIGDIDRYTYLLFRRANVGNSPS
jgi:GH24 family phage-related lysozyme (muramidase)